jgi:hypothetical protein
MGGYLRAAGAGMYASSTGCGASVHAVGAPPPAAGATTPAAVSVAILRLVITTKSTPYSCSYYRLRINQTNSSDLLGLDEQIDGGEFYSALLGNAERWGGYMEAATSAQLPASDRRYADTAAALVSGYLNDFRGEWAHKFSQCRQCCRSIHCLTCSGLLCYHFVHLDPIHQE